mmetsp:Transcript_4471/g.11533  ORF Transcript_4471/g.11533 Transcript_4471/m.11533 type:complete len:764 (-) Transcript_4471:353-2644(-)
MNQYRAVASASPVVPIAPSPLVVAPAPVATGTTTATATAPAGHKRRKLNSSNSIHSTAAAAIASSSGIPRRESAPATLTPQHTAAKANATPIPLKPSEYWKAALEEWLIPILDTVGIEQDQHGPDTDVVFLETTADRVEAYQNIELLAAVRRRDLVKLREIAAEHRSAGGTMDACNRFGESILHLACRKGSLDVVELLLEECGCSLLVRDDYGRTVLHDACWTVHPPWELLKLILKKAPLLWRVSDVRGHLALQYVPKSAWPQWSAFLSKNRGLLQRIMVHSYHKIDILTQPLPQPKQPQQPQQRVKQEDSSMNDAAMVTQQTHPQHHQTQQQQQQQRVATLQQPLQPQPQQQPHMPQLTPVSHAVSQQIPVKQQVSISHRPHAYAPGPTIAVRKEPSKQLASSALSTGIGVASAAQAHEVLARALAQANPAMVQAIQREQPLGSLQQGLSRYSPTRVANPRAPAAPSAAKPMAMGPATAALDEALRAQSAMRSRALMNEQRNQSGHPSPGDHAFAQNQQQQEVPAQAPDGGRSQAPLPHAPSNMVINERLGGYQNSTANSNSNNTSFKPVNQESPLESRNPLPAVPNPLLATQAAATPLAGQEHHVFPSNHEQQRQQQQKGVPTSITTRKDISNDPLVPNPMAAASSSKDSPSCNSSNNNSNGTSGGGNIGNSISSCTMSDSPSVLEETVSGTTTDTDSDRAAAPSSTPSSTPSASSNAEAGTSGEMPNLPADTGGGREGANNGSDGSDKLPEDGSKKRVVG